MRFYHVGSAVSHQQNADKTPRSPITGSDALIMAVAVFGILMGVSLLSFQVAVAVGVLALGFVLFKLFTTEGRAPPDAG